MKVFPEIEVKISFTGKEITNKQRLSSPVFQKFQKGVVINSNIIEAGTSAVLNLKDNEQTGADYLIITAPEFETQANALGSWKQTKGLTTLVVTTAETGVTTENIKNFIQNAYYTWTPAPTYLLLLGDVEDIPTNYETVHPLACSDTGCIYDEEHRIGTDLYYSTLEGDDVMPDILLGRISVDTVTEAETVIQKIIHYEQNPPSLESFYSKVIVAGSFEDNITINNQNGSDGYEDLPFIQICEEVRDHLIETGYHTERIYYAKKSVNPRYYSNERPLPEDLLKANGFAWAGVSQDIITSINNGVFLAFYLGHGLDRNNPKSSHAGWYKPAFNENHIPELTNGELLPLVLSLTCENGWFDGETDDYASRSYECFAELLLCKENGGAVGVVASSRISYGGYTDYLAKGIIDYIWPDFLPEVDNDPVQEADLGRMLLHGKLSMDELWGDEELRQEHYELFNIQGDPSLTFMPWKIHVYPGQSIQSAIDTAFDGQEIIVHPGTYIENINLSGRSLILRNEDPSNPDLTASTIIDCNQVGSVITFQNGDASELIGFTLQNGKGDFGGGIYCDQSSPTISKCILINNSANHHGGGISCSSSSLNISNCIITKNTAIEGGGGIYGHSSSMDISSCTISQNSANYGGGISCFSSSSLIIINCIISRNEADNYGGGIYSHSSSPSINSCTISRNTADCGGGIYGDSSEAIIKNSIIWKNAPEEIYGDTPIISFSCMQDSNTESGNIAANPLFIDPNGDNFHLQTGSPCIDAGTNENAPSEDKDGISRPRDGNGDSIAVGDMGAYEAYEHRNECPSYDCGTFVPNLNYTIHSGFFNPGKGRIYRFNLTENVPYIFTTCTGGGSYSSATSFRLYNSSCDQVAGDNNSCGPGSHLEYIPIESGYYYLKIYNKKDNDDDPENFTLAYKEDSYSIKIEGPAEVPETSTRDYNCRIIYSNGSSRPIEPAWTVDCPSNAQISATGSLTTYETSSSLNCQIAAEYSLGGRCVSDTFSLTILPKYTVTIFSTNGGSVINPGEGVFIYPINQAVSLEAEADSGYYLNEWIGTCIDAGMVDAPNEAETTISLTGDCELVADFEPLPTVYVPDDYATIQAAIDDSRDGWIIIVRPGTYFENINFLGKAVTLKSTDPDDSQVTASTIIDGQQAGSVVTFANNEDSTCVLKGMTIYNGNSSYGGGIFCSNTSPSISNCIIRGNTAEKGGGIYCSNSSPNINNCTIGQNFADYGGGICHSLTIYVPDYIYNYTIKNCTFSENRANFDGGGIFCDSYISLSSFHPYLFHIMFNYTLLNCSIIKNTAELKGGGIFCSAPSNFFPYDSYISKNCTILNCTFSENRAGNNGGGIYGDPGFSLKITNSILWENLPNELHADAPLNPLNPLNPLISYSCITGDYGDPLTTHNIDADPLFLNPNNDSYHLSPNSPCIDTGNSAAKNLSEKDREGHPRKFNGIPDMGAYEYFLYFTVYPILYTVYPGLNIPPGLEDSWTHASDIWNFLINRNITPLNIQLYQPESSTWLSYAGPTWLDFPLVSGRGWLLYAVQNEPVTISFSYPPTDFSSQLYPGRNFISSYYLNNLHGLSVGKEYKWPKFGFDLLEEKSGKQGTCVITHNGKKGKWGAVYPFFGKAAGSMQDIKNKGYGIYCKE